MKFSLGLGVLISIAIAAFATHFYSVHRYGDGGAFRNPAAINPRALDLSDEQVVDSVSKRRILSGTRAWKEDGNVAIRLGHFVAKGVDGQTANLCELYRDISLTFAAEGIATSGARPTMTIESACRVANNIESTETIWIPVGQIKTEKPADAELRFTSPSDVFIRVKDIPDEWPTYWVLKEIKFLNKADGRSIVIDTPTIYKLSQIPVTMTWN